MSNLKPIKPSDKQAKEWLKEASHGERRLLFSTHAELRMRQRKIGRRQVLETLRHGCFSEPLHQDVHGDWKCNVTWLYAGLRLTVGVIFKLKENGEWVVVATVFEE